jgi:SulP family sulfate permease
MKRMLAGFALNNVFAGLIVAVVALPLCIAFAVASGAHPMAGIVAGVVGGFLAAAFGASRFQVSGPSAAFVTIVFGILAQHGPAVLLASTLAAGVVLLGIAALRLGGIVDLMPHSVLVGFGAGIGALIVLGQVPAALGIDAQGADVLARLADAARRLPEAGYQELPVLLATLATALLWGRGRLGARIPAPLAALAAGTALAQAMIAAGMPVRTLGSLYAIEPSALAVSPAFLGALASHAPVVVLSGLTLGFLIAMETLLAARALDHATGASHDPNGELRGVALANLAVPFFGGLPVSGVIVRGSLSVASGASDRSAAMLHAAFLALFVALLAEAIGRLPLAALAGVLVLTGARLIEWRELARVLRIDRREGALALLTIVLTVAADLTVSVPVAVSLTLLLALRRMLEDKRLDVVDQHGHTVVAVGTSITFLTAAAMREEIAHHCADARVRVLDLTGVHYIDASGAMMIARLLAEHPALAVWTKDQPDAEKLRHAGASGERIEIIGSPMVNLPAVYRALSAPA